MIRVEKIDDSSIEIQGLDNDMTRDSAIKVSEIIFQFKEENELIFIYAEPPSDLVEKINDNLERNACNSEIVSNNGVDKGIMVEVRIVNQLAEAFVSLWPFIYNSLFIGIVCAEDNRGKVIKIIKESHKKKRFFFLFPYLSFDQNYVVGKIINKVGLIFIYGPDGETMELHSSRGSILKTVSRLRK